MAGSHEVTGSIPVSATKYFQAKHIAWPVLFFREEVSHEDTGQRLFDGRRLPLRCDIETQRFREGIPEKPRARLNLSRGDGWLAHPTSTA